MMQYIKYMVIKGLKPKHFSQSSVALPSYFLATI